MSPGTRLQLTYPQGPAEIGMRDHGQLLSGFREGGGSDTVGPDLLVFVKTLRNH